jgi:hypothetical protein
MRIAAAAAAAAAQDTAVRTALRVQHIQQIKCAAGRIHINFIGVHRVGRGSPAHQHGEVALHAEVACWDGVRLFQGSECLLRTTTQPSSADDATIGPEQHNTVMQCDAKRSALR